ncbi:MAG: cytochrome c biogenesis heme-transporting ATPase CcmA [Limnohabitans sp.]|nr:cytochrome c biogenesis heme-transporting ATPase CcmA [Limnohabitans sp.]
MTQDLRLQVHSIACERGGRWLFEDVSFSVQKGQALYLQGNNGVGKTTMLRMLCGLTPCIKGDIQWRGQSIIKNKMLFNRDLLYWGHLFAFKDELTPLENLQIDAAIAGFAVEKEEVQTALNNQGLINKHNLAMKFLSQGQKRRVALARLQLSRASLWVLDEPLVALDHHSVNRLRSLLTTHLAKGGLLIFTSHQPILLDMELIYFRLGL